MPANIPAHLPRRLTISFPIWGLEDTAPSGAYHDLDRFVREHVERGFNCIRLESGAGLTHDLDGNRLPPAQLNAPFGKYSDNRQLFVIGGEGKCDLMQRLIDLCEACKKYDVYLILSSWYYLHTYWYCDKETNARLLGLPVEDRFMAFAKFLHYILAELEQRGLSDRIAAAEIFNEMGDFPTLWSRAGHDEQHILSIFRLKHEEAMAYLQEEHPNILFSCDDLPQPERMPLFPRNMQAFNGHNYFLWDVYGNTLEAGENAEREPFFRNEITDEDIVNAYKDLHPNYSPDWIARTRCCHDLDESKLPALYDYLENRLNEKRDVYMAGFEKSIEGYQTIMRAFPGIPVVCGEGVTYCSSKKALWEETSDRYWEMVAYAMRRYKEIGLWGTVVKTCCGPEDPCWTLCKDKLLALNTAFLSD